MLPMALHHRHLLCKCPTWPHSNAELACFPAMHSYAMWLEVIVPVNSMMLSALLQARFQTFLPSSFLTLSFHDLRVRRRKSLTGISWENLLENNFLIGFICNLYFKWSLSICHYVPSCAKGSGGLTEKTLKWWLP